MRLFLAFVLLLLVPGLGPAQQPDPRLGEHAPYGLPAVLNCDGCGQLVVRDRYLLFHDNDIQSALWVAYSLREEHMTGAVDRTEDFREDPDVVGERGELDDYSGSGYDRGHLIPAAAASGGRDWMSSTFYLSNMSPQTAALNRGQWAALEAQERVWAKNRKELFVVVGPIFDPHKARAEIGDGVDVPTHYFRVLAARNSEGKLNTIGFLMPNLPSGGPKFQQCAASVDAIELASGIDFFSGLDDGEEELIESRMDFTFWQVATQPRPTPVTSLPTTAAPAAKVYTIPAPSRARVSATATPLSPELSRYLQGVARDGVPVGRANGTSVATVYVTKSGEKYHRSGCRYLRSSAFAIPLESARASYSPCSVCNPP